MTQGHGPVPHPASGGGRASAPGLVHKLTREEFLAGLPVVEDAPEPAGTSIRGLTYAEQRLVADAALAFGVYDADEAEPRIVAVGASMDLEAARTMRADDPDRFDALLADVVALSEASIYGR